MKNDELWQKKINGIKSRYVIKFPYLKMSLTIISILLLNFIVILIFNVSFTLQLEFQFEKWFLFELECSIEKLITILRNIGFRIKINNLNTFLFGFEIFFLSTKACFKLIASVVDFPAACEWKRILEPFTKPKLTGLLEFATQGRRLELIGLLVRLVQCYDADKKRKLED